MGMNQFAPTVNSDFIVILPSKVDWMGILLEAQYLISRRMRPSFNKSSLGHWEQIIINSYFRSRMAAIPLAYCHEANINKVAYLASAWHLLHLESVRLVHYGLNAKPWKYGHFIYVHLRFRFAEDAFDHLGLKLNVENRQMKVPSFIIKRLWRPSPQRMLDLADITLPEADIQDPYPQIKQPFKKGILKVLVLILFSTGIVYFQIERFTAQQRPPVSQLMLRFAILEFPRLIEDE
jgi:lipopolysaccharide biosynthesis glycosyltransferase